MTDKARLVKVRKSVLAGNEAIADINRNWLAERHVVALNLISSPGTGKTTLLERTLERLRGRVSCAVIAGDQQTDNDARRLRGHGAPVVQIETGSSCHLNAEQVHTAMQEVVQADTRLLFIENVGNLVCPAIFDLGEAFKVALMATTEGEDKPVKYPRIFTDARTVVITKIDLIPHLDWDINRCRQYVRQINPAAPLFELSARTGEGMDDWLAYLGSLPSVPQRA
jgi:hydrogenase nickel incorporation protein HypB